MKLTFFGKSKSIVFTLFAVALLNLSAFDQTAFADKFSDDEFQIFQLINTERHKNQLGNLEWDDKLADAARDYSQKMARENFFEHSDSNGKTVVDRVRERRIKNWSKIGENLFACGGIDDFDVFAVRGWMKSPTHRRNILDDDWTATGIGIAKSKNGEIFITQIFIEK